MSYSAVIVRIQGIKKHPNADRLMLATVLGYQVIVALDAKEGDIGIYFPSGGQLSKEYAESNDLIRRKDAEGNNTGGMFCERRRVRIQKLRKEISDGYFAPLTSLVGIESQPVGFEFTEWRGVPICNKYIVKPKQKFENKKGKGSKNYGLQCETFLPHFDTTQFQRQLDKFVKGDHIIITEKAHGCFLYKTQVSMSDGTKKKIIDIKVGDSVLGYKEGKIVPTLVESIFDNGSINTPWTRLEFEGTGLRGNRPTTFSTPCHRFYSPDKKDYTRAEDLKVGDRVLASLKSFKMSSEQRQILLGKVLGDGSVAKPRGNKTSVAFTHGEKQLPYFTHCVEVLADIFRDTLIVPKKVLSGYGTQMYSKVTKSSFEMIGLRENFYSEDGRVVPKDFKLTPLTLAYWYMDDGSLSHSSKQKDRASFASCSFTEESVDTLVECFSALGLVAVKQTSKNTSGRICWRIRLNTLAAYKMFNMIAQFIPDCMRYKLPADLDVGKYQLPEVPDSTVCFEEVYTTVRSISTKIESGKKWDIQTGTSNFFASKILVHNSSARVCNLPVQMSLPWYTKLFRKLLGRSLVNEKYMRLVGTRRVILGEFEKLNPELFRTRAASVFINDLKEGETVYGELVGWEHMGRTIMPSVSKSKLKKVKLTKYLNNVPAQTMDYSYGVEEGQVGQAVYRITQLDEEGVPKELTWAEVKVRCQELNILHVNEMHDFIYDGDLDRLVAFCDKEREGFSWVDPSHIREGIVIRVERKNEMFCLKHKSIDFKLVEGMISDEGILDPEDNN